MGGFVCTFWALVLFWLFLSFCRCSLVLLSSLCFFLFLFFFGIKMIRGAFLSCAKPLRTLAAPSASASSLLNKRTLCTETKEEDETHTKMTLHQVLFSSFFFFSFLFFRYTFLFLLNLFFLILFSSFFFSFLFPKAVNNAMDITLAKDNHSYVFGEDVAFGLFCFCFVFFKFISLLLLLLFSYLFSPRWCVPLLHEPQRKIW